MQHVDLYFTDYVDEMRKNRESQERIAALNIAAQNRVNISLDDYNKLINEITELKRNNEALKEREGAIGLLLSKLDIPFEELEIISDDISVMKDDNFMDLSTNYIIKFAARRR